MKLSSFIIIIVTIMRRDDEVFRKVNALSTWWGEVTLITEIANYCSVPEHISVIQK